MEYDSNVIVEFASKLYSKASSVVITYAFFGVVLGGIAGFSVLQNSTSAIAGAVVIGLVGLKLGIDKSFQLKLQAQMALCQVKIESNTA